MKQTIPDSAPLTIAEKAVVAALVRAIVKELRADSDTRPSGTADVCCSKTEGET